jgi:hypothetical protein
LAGKLIKKRFIYSQFRGPRAWHWGGEGRKRRDLKREGKQETTNPVLEAKSAQINKRLISRCCQSRGKGNLGSCGWALGSDRISN